MVSVPDVTPLPPRNGGGADGVICFADRNQARNRTECEFPFSFSLHSAGAQPERLLVLIEALQKEDLHITLLFLPSPLVSIDNSSEIRTGCG